MPTLPTLLDCVHCGLCVPACPTYAVTGREAESPRGRIAALRAVDEGRASFTNALRTGLDHCLVCRACESVCPAGISMDEIMAGHRARTRPRLRDIGARVERAVLRHVFPFHRRVAAVATLVRVAAPILRLLAPRLAADLPSAARLGRAPRLVAPAPGAAPAAAAPRGTVTIFRGCVADRWFRVEALAAARVLARNGWRVAFQASPVCCGALHRHAGLTDLARDLVRRNAESLLGSAVPDAERPQHIIVDAAACRAALAAPQSDGGELVADMAARVTSTLDLLHRAGWTPPRARLAGDWVVAHPCHEPHAPGSGVAATRAILDAVLAGGCREMPPPEHCCGAAGLFLARHRALSHEIGRQALARFEASGAQGVITGNPGCLLRWETLLSTRRGGEVLHPLVALDRAYTADMPTPARPPA